MSPVAAGTGAFSYDRPGRLVRLPDGRRMNFRCMGHGSTTVLLESGFGADSSIWGTVQSQVALVTRVCAYDRAGYAFSDPGPLPRDGAAVARDLDRGLEAAGIPGPFVVVGHSAGGLYARLFAARRRGEVKGLIFIDTSIPYQDRRMAAALGPGAGGVEGIQRRVQACLDATSGPRGKTIAAAVDNCLPKRGGPHARLVALRAASWRNQLSEINTLFTTTSDQVSRMGELLKDIPAIVLTASRTDPAVPPEDAGAALWRSMHRELAASFEKGDQRVVRSSHLMMNDRPQVIIDAIVEQAVKASAPRP